MTPVDITLSSTASGQIKLTWSDNGADSWLVAYNANKIVVNADGSDSYSTTFTGVATNTTVAFEFYSLSDDGGSERKVIETKLNYCNTFSVAATNATNFTCTWTADAGATNYKIERSTDNGVTWTTLTEEATGTSYADSTVNQNTVYLYRITPVDPLGANLAHNSSSVAFWIPESLNALCNGRTVQLTATRPAGHSGSVLIDYSANGGSTWRRVANTASAYTHSGLVAGNTALYRAYITSPDRSVYAGPLLIPYSVNIWNCMPVMGNRIYLNWDIVADCDAYKVERSTNQHDWTELTSAVNPALESNSGDFYYFYDTTAVAGTTYYYRVSCTVSGTEYQSDNVSVILIADVATLTAVRYSSSQITLTWTAAAGATNYKIERSTDNGVTWTNVTTLTTLTYRMTVTLNQRYLARVTAVGSGGWAVAGPFYQPSANALNPTVALNSSGRPVLTWTELDCAEIYVVERRNSGVGNYVALGTTGDSTYTDSSCERLTAYQYRVGMYDPVADTYLYDSVIAITSGDGFDYPIAPESPTLELIDNIYAPLSALRTVGTLSAIDANDPETFTFSLVTGEGDTDNSKFAILETSLLAAENLPAGDYSIRVRVTDSDDLTAEAVLTFSLGLAHLNAPAGLTATPDYHTLDVVFGAVTGAAGYRLEWQQTGAASWSGADLATPPSVKSPYEITGLTTGTLYSLRVKSIADPDMNLDSGWANSAVLTTADNEAPVITLSSSDGVKVELNASVTLPSATAVDAVDGACGVSQTFYQPSGDSTPDTALSEIDTSVSGTYYVIFSSCDLSGNVATKRLDIIVGLENLFAPAGLTATPDYHTLDVVFGAVTGAQSYRLEWQQTGAASWSGADLATPPSVESPYEITGLATGTSYDVRVKAVGDGVENLDSVWAITTKSTTADTVGPVIAVTLNGSAFTADSIEINTGETLEIPSATAFDIADGDCEVVIVITNNLDDSVVAEIDTSIVGDYTVVYSSVDESGNTAERTVAVSVSDPVPPVVTVNDYGESGSTTAIVPLGGTYTEYGATAVDAVDGVLTPVITGSVNVSVAGIYRVTYTAADESGNTASAQRIVIVGTIPMEAAAETQHSIHVRWANIGLAVDVQRRDSGSDVWSTIASGVSGTYYEDASVVSEQRYYYRLTLDGITVSDENIAWTLTVTHYSYISEMSARSIGGTPEEPGPGDTPSTIIWGVIQEIAKPYTILTETTFMTTELKRNEAVVFCARIFDTNTDEIIQSDNVSSISYTAYKVNTTSLNRTRTAVENHSNVPVSISDVLLEQCINDDYWTQDEIGYNFIHQPDIRTNALFSQTGLYHVVYTIVQTVGNPITITYEVKVVS